MRAFFLGTCREQPAPNRAVIRLCAPVGVPLLLSLAFGAAMLYVLSVDSQVQDSRTAFQAMFGLGAGGIAGLFLQQGVGSRVEVVVDAGKRTLALRSPDVSAEWPLSQVRNARVARRSGTGMTSGKPCFRLDVVLHNGDVVRATRGFHPYADGDCARVADAINRVAQASR